MAKNYVTKPDDKTPRFIPTRPGFGRGNNSKLAKFNRWLNTHAASLSRKRKGHGRQ